VHACRRWSRQRRVRTRAASSAILALLVVVTLGSSPHATAATPPTKPLKTWATSICTGFTRWQRQVSRLAANGPVGDLLHGADAQNSPDTIRLGIPVFLSGALTATTVLARDVGAAGIPKVAGGTTIAATVAAGVQVLDADLAAFQTRAEQLGPNEPGPQFSESNDLATLLESAGKTLPATLTGLEAQYPQARLGRAFAAIKVCQPLL
jgi:hypothetical protein